MSSKRISKIYELCEKNTTVTVEELARMFGVSDATIRRDLLEMEDQHMVTRFYGGAKINEEHVREKGYRISSLSHVDEKKSIGKYAATLIHDNDIVYIDSGSTTIHMIDYIFAKNIMVVTESISILDKLVDRNINCYVAGGNLRPNTGIIVGTETTEKIRSMHFNSVFLGANSVSYVTGFTTTNEPEAQLKAAALEKGVNKYILIDSSKFDKLNFFKFSDIKGVSVITDSRLEDFDYSIFDDVVFTDELGIKVPAR